MERETGGPNGGTGIVMEPGAGGTSAGNGGDLGRCGRKEKGKPFRWIGICVIAASLVSLAIMAVMYATGIIHNQTDSIPTGFYRRVQRPPKKGELVIVTTPRNEFTDTHPVHEGLIKNLVAVEGDRVAIDGQGIRVNGVLLEKSRPVDFLEPANVDKTLEAGEIIVASAYNRLSYDSRYFGIIEANTVQCVVEPLWTWGKPIETIAGREMK